MEIKVVDGLMYVYFFGEFVGTAMSYDEACANVRDFLRELTESN